MSKSRAISFPYISLEAAMSRASELYKKDGKNLVNPEVLVTHWGYSERSSGGIRTIAALRAFGLIESSADGVRISDLGLRILLDKREDSTERDESLKIAALSSKVIAEMWNKWRQSGLPSDATISHFLIFQKGMNERSANRAVKVFRETITFAKLFEPEPAPLLKEDEETEEADVVKEEEPIPEIPEQKTDDRRYSFPLQEGEATLQLPRELSVDSGEEVKAWLEFIVNRLERSKADKETEEI